jgi:hypothetical protein
MTPTLELLHCIGFSAQAIGLQLTICIGRLDHQLNSNKLQTQWDKVVSSYRQCLFWKTWIDRDFCKFLVSQ